MSDERDGQLEGNGAEQGGAAQEASADALIDLLTGRAVRSTPRNRLVQKVLRQLIETCGFDRSPDGEELVFDDEVVERVRIGAQVRSQTVRRRQRHVDDELPAVARRYRAFVEGGRRGP